MLHQDKFIEPTSQNPDLRRQEVVSPNTETHVDLDIEQQLNLLENSVLEGVRIPLTDLIIVDEAVILDRIDSLVRNLPPALALALEVLQRKQEIIQKAEDYARNLVISAEQKAEEILQDSVIIRQAEIEAAKIKYETQQECEKLRTTTKEEVEKWRKLARVEYEDIQQGADDYAKKVLSDLEEQLTQMLVVTRNGRQQIESNSQQHNQ